MEREICQSCGGILGRDCFNPVECDDEMILRYKYHNHHARQKKKNTKL